MSFSWNSSILMKLIIRHKSPSLGTVKTPSIKKYIYAFMEKTSCFTKKKYSGSMTVEASLVLPLFIMLFVNLSCIFVSIQKYTTEKVELWNYGKQIVLYTELIPNNSSNILIDNDCLDIKKYSSTFSLFKEPRLNPIVMEERFYCHLWNGYNLEAVTDNEGIIAYITSTGSVYHKDRTCTYLNLSVHSIVYDAVLNLENQYGEKYRPCELCGKDITEEIVYITEMGNAIHSTKDCISLKRTVHSVLLSEVKDYKPCHRCN